MGDIGSSAALCGKISARRSVGRKNTITEIAPHKWRGNLCGGMGIIMKQRKKTSVVTKAASVALAVVLLLSSGSTVFAGKTLAENINFKEQIKLEDVLYNYNYFGDYVKEKEKDFSDVTDTEIKLDIHGYSAFKGAAPVAKTLEGKENVLYIPNENTSITWEFTVEKAGFYEITFEYLPVDGNSLPVTKGFQIDGKYLYDELSTIKFARHYVDSEKPRTNSLGDHVRPSQLEVQEWTVTDLYDAQGEYASPLKVALTEGTHTITMVHIDQPIAIASFSLTAPEQLKSYAEVKKEYETKGYKNATKAVRFEAEDKDHVLYKTDSSITIANSSDSTLTPQGVTSRKYNHIGAASWSTGGQEISWKFTVEESGLYQLAPRLYQAYGNGLSSTRRIEIDGEVPFEEFNEYVFVFEDGWQTKPLVDKDSNPYLIYLDEGNHTISMKVVTGQMTEVVHLLMDVTSRMSNAYRNITMITGQSPDLNYDYGLEKQITSLISDMEIIRDELKDVIARVDAFANKTTSIENNLTITVEMIEEIIKDPDVIPSNLSNITSSITSIGTWLSDVKSQSLALDFIRFTDPDEKVVNDQETFWDMLRGMFMNFILSYQKDYTAIGSFAEENEDYETIEVMVAQSREWLEILKDLIDSDFTKKYKTNVKLNILTSGDIGSSGGPLLLAINAGTAPDVILGSGPETAINYAIRDVMYDISKFDDYEEVKKRFLAESFVPLTYEGGVYGLPETISFKATFVRTDIFEQLDLKVPNTWDELVDDLLPQLYSYNMQCDVPTWYGVHIYQNGGQYYSDSVYSSKLNSPEVLKGMDQLTSFFTDYGCPIQVSFLNRFRSGEIPIGIGTWANYQQLVFSAPELTGKWKMYPIPATVMEDGTLNRCSSDVQGGSVSILSTVEDDLADNAWEFIKWYTSADVQTDYGRQIETILGIQSRYLSANLEAFRRLPWTTYELEIIEESLKWAKEVPNGLGTYLCSRTLSNAYNRIVVTGTQTVREAMEQAHEELDTEMKRKQVMYRVNLEGKE